MRTDFSQLEKWRERGGKYDSPVGAQYGKFMIFRNRGLTLEVVCDNGCSDEPGDEHLRGWEHVSVSAPVFTLIETMRVPTWDEMCFIKKLFWTAKETVIQFHPRQSEYINRHPHVLHLWKKVGQEWELPPSDLV